MAISNSTNMSIRLDKNLKKEAETLFKNLGLNMTTAINMFLTQSVREQSIPFKSTMEKPNKKLLKALQEAERINKDSNVSGYDTIEDLIKALDE